MAHWSARSIRRGSQNSEWPRKASNLDLVGRCLARFLQRLTQLTNVIRPAVGLHHLKRSWLPLREWTRFACWSASAEGSIESKVADPQGDRPRRDVHRLDIEITNDLKPEFLLGVVRAVVARMLRESIRIWIASSARARLRMFPKGASRPAPTIAFASCPRCHEAERPPSLPACW